MSALVLLSNLLTHSRLKTERECSQLHWLKYLLGYRPTEDKAELFFGTLIHLALEAWWNAVKAKLPEDEWYRAAIAALRSVENVDPFDLVRAEVLIAGYHARWAADAALYEVLGVEQRFEFALVNPATGGRSPVWRVGGKLDVRVRRLIDNVVGFIEHKTSGEDVSVGSAYWACLKMDAQVSIYFDGAGEIGDDAKFCLYDVIGKPGQRPSNVPVVDDDGIKIVFDGKGERVRTLDGKKWRQTADSEKGYILQTRTETPEEFRLRLLEVVSEQPDRFFTRGEVVRLDSELDQARAEVWQQAAVIRENANADRHLRNPEACRRGQRLCAFFPICTGVASLDDRSLFTRSTNVHPELTEVVDASPG